MPLLTAEQVKTAELNAIEAGVSESDLMLRAGNAIGDMIDLESGESGKAVILAGPGNNGGDGVVIGARLHARGWEVSIWGWQRTRSGNAPISEEMIDSLNWLASPDELEEALGRTDIVIDAVYGAGGRDELPDEVAAAFDMVCSERSHRRIDVWAVDLPSGVNSDTGEVSERSISADVTAMIGFPKVGCFKSPASRIVGRPTIVDIGLELPDDLFERTPVLVTSRFVRQRMPDRHIGQHKRSAGTLLVVGGSPQYYGAPRLTGESALRSGSGLVSLAVPATIVSPIATAVPELTFITLPSGEHATAGSRMARIVREKLDEYDALVVGPGLGTDPPVRDFLGIFLGLDQPGTSGIGFGTHAEPESIEPFSGKAVFDADALNLLSERFDWSTKLENAELVLTPHAGELGRLLDRDRADIESDPWGSALEAAKQFKQVVLLKSAPSLVATPDGALFVAKEAPIGLATAGTGDVLAGIVGALMSQGLGARDAAITGMGLGNTAANLAESEIGELGYVASDLISFIPAARDRIMQSRSDFV